jgi:integrase
MPVPIPQALARAPEAHQDRYGSPWVVSHVHGGQMPPRTLGQGLERAGWAHGFHGLRHYFASVLIAAGLDVRTVQARLRHDSATTTLETYAHLWPTSDDRTRQVVAGLLPSSVGSLLDS